MKHHHRLINEIKQRIVGMIMDQFNAPGEKLPSIRALTGKMRCSHMTVVHAIRELCAEGILETRPKSGIFVASLPSRPQLLRQPYLRTLYFFYYPSAIQLDAYHTDIFQILSREAAWKRWNFRLENLADSEAFQRACGDPHAAGIVIQAYPQHICLNLEEESLADLPLVAYGMGPAEETASVSPDNYQGGWDLAEILFRRQESDFCFVLPGERSPFSSAERIYWERRHGVEDFLRTRNLELQSTLSWSVNGGTDPLIAYLKQCRKKRRRPVLIVTNCSMAKEIKLLAGGMGLLTPRDFSLAAFCRRGTEDRNANIPCMDFSHEEMANAIIHLLGLPDLIRNRTRMMVKMKFVDAGQENFSDEASLPEPIFREENPAKAGNTSTGR